MYKLCMQCIQELFLNAFQDKGSREQSVTIVANNKKQREEKRKPGYVLWMLFKIHRRNYSRHPSSHMKLSQCWSRRLFHHHPLL